MKLERRAALGQAGVLERRELVQRRPGDQHDAADAGGVRPQRQGTRSASAWPARART